MLKDKKAQEEMVGFAIIVIIVSVIILVLLSFYLKSDNENIESYETESFIQAGLQYTTDCQGSYKYLDVQDLIFECEKENLCSDGRKACEVLNSTLKELTEKSWYFGEDRPIKGYELKITSGEKRILSFKEGNITNDYKGSVQSLPHSIDIFLRVYY